MGRWILSVLLSAAMVWIAPTLWFATDAAEACGVKSPVRSRANAARVLRSKSNTPSAVRSKEEREPIRTGPDDEQPVRTSETSQPTRSGGGDDSETSTPEPTREPTDSGSDVDDTRVADTTEPDEPEDPPEVEDEPEEPAPRPSKARAPAGSFTKRLFFASGSSDLSPKSESLLKKNIRWLKANPDKTITIEGHANTPGDEDSNMTLSEGRAEAVKDMLVSGGIDPSRISVVGFGEERPHFQPGTSGKNRRVEIRID